ncbi:hypothetical protein K3G63_09430 [Hymenobacter sp. HSC-4F20]|uniref:hypothetical protein n=1 Tax=Hymenobacter sp. HSC-4F20 TaxID=2864135 RepID=UPI001C7387D2|nr:hypothetical protein [Hymenobacter sp. HSC-4F20]MBX0290658.1 hypothetical protein [Hymenobacter sp. HSC-4F20]
MKMKASPVWIGALVAGGTAAFYFWQKKDAPKASQPGTDALANGAAPAASASTAAPSSTSSFRTPTAANGHVRDVSATDLPAPDTGTNFTVQGDVHEPSSNG